MPRNRSAREIDDFLGSAHIFASSVADIIEQRLLEKATEGQVTPSQMRLLKLVAMTDAYTLGDVASFLRVSNAAASKAVERLVRRDMLRRIEDRKDRRVMHLRLTQAGVFSCGSHRKNCGGPPNCWTASRRTLSTTPRIRRSFA